MVKKVLCVLAVASACLLCAAPSSAQSANPEGVATDFAKAWNSQDVKAFERLFAEHAVWVPTAEYRAVGNAQVVEAFAAILPMLAKDTIMTVSSVLVESVSPDISVVYFLSTVESLALGGDLKPAPPGAVILVTVREKDGWRIAGGQLTRAQP